MERYKQEEELFVKIVEGLDKGKTFPTFEAPVAYERQLTLTRRRSWPNLIKQSAAEVTHSHVTLNLVLIMMTNALSW